jgi:hypothetical protein
MCESIAVPRGNGCRNRVVAACVIGLLHLGLALRNSRARYSPASIVPPLLVFRSRHMVHAIRLNSSAHASASPKSAESSDWIGALVLGLRAGRASSGGNTVLKVADFLLHLVQLRLQRSELFRGDHAPLYSLYRRRKSRLRSLKLIRRSFSRVVDVSFGRLDHLLRSQVHLPTCYPGSESHYY